jgi:hypothetical protein
MNAEEAKKMSNKALTTKSVGIFIKHIDIRIKQQASSGGFSIMNPHIGKEQRGFSFVLSTDERKVIRMHYENLGFIWTVHADPDPGHPCSQAYITLEW